MLSTQLKDTILTSEINLKEVHPNMAGELLREAFFVGGYGAYSSFDMNPDYGFEEVDPHTLDLYARTLLLGFGAKNYKEVTSISCYKNPDDWEVMWHWDGGGCLAIRNQRFDFLIYNSDCTHPDYWNDMDYEDWVDEAIKMGDKYYAANYF